MINDGEATRFALIGLIENHRLAFDAATETRAGRAFRCPLIVAVAEIVDTAQIHEHFEAQVGLTPQDRCRLQKVVRLDLVRQLPARGWIWQEDGTVELVAYNPSQAGEQRSWWDNPRSCQGKNPINLEK